MSNRDFVARLMFSTQAFTVVALAVGQENSIPAFTLQYGGWLLTAALAIVGALLMMDLVINDIMPERFSFLQIMHLRHWVYPVASFCYAATLFISQQEGKEVETGAIIMYGTMVFFGFLLSFRNILFIRGRACKP